MNELYDTIAKFLFVLGVLGLLACLGVFLHFWVEERRIKRFLKERKKAVEKAVTRGTMSVNEGRSYLKDVENDNRTRRQAR